MKNTIADQLEADVLQGFHADFRRALLMLRKSVMNIIFRLQFPHSQAGFSFAGNTSITAIDFRLWLREQPPKDVAAHGVYRHLLIQQHQLQSLVEKALSAAAAEGLDESLFLSLLHKLNEFEHAADRLLGGVTTSLTDIDELTGVLNRTALERDIASPEAFIKTGQTLVVAMIDADHFKQVNDEYGHLVGDFVLEALAERLSNSIRAQDRLYRYGGEEFTLLLPDTDAAQAEAILHRLLLSISNDPISNDEIAINQTISIGYSVCNSPVGISACIQSADEALYEAKDAGRNQTKRSNDTEPCKVETRDAAHPQ